MIPWSQQTISGMVNQPLSSVYRKDYVCPEYLRHKIDHDRGMSRKAHRGEVRMFGHHEFRYAWTPEGLAGNWEMPYIKRILAGESGDNFVREIRNSPLPGGTKKNLIKNILSRPR